VNHSVFGYPGNKASLSDWIVQHLADHRIYVEVFGGAAGVLANKPQSHNEVYNDIDEDLVQFFDVLRERGAELREWLTHVPYSREKYDEWVTPWYQDDWRPDDPVKRAGVFFYHRCVAFGGTYQYEPGFATSTTRNQARTFSGQVDRLEQFAERFQGVVIENLDWRECVEEYDTEDALLYFDPPYYDARCRYRHGRNFDHDELADALARVDGEWLVSYGELPPAVQERAESVVERTVWYQMGAGYNGESDPSTETLAMSYDLSSAPRFVDDTTAQQTLVAAIDGGASDHKSTDTDDDVGLPQGDDRSQQSQDTGGEQVAVGTDGGRGVNQQNRVKTGAVLVNTDARGDES